MKKRLNIPTGVVRGSEEEKLQKIEKKKSREEKCLEYLQFLESISKKGGQRGVEERLGNE